MFELIPGFWKRTRGETLPQDWTECVHALKAACERGKNSDNFFFFTLIAGLNFFFKFHRNSKSVVVYFILHSKGTCTYWICHTYKHHKGSKRDKVICINHRFKVVQHLLKMETVSYQCFDEELTLCSGFFLFFLYGNRYFASNVT